jgi:hypothetical protein
MFHFDSCNEIETGIYNGSVENPLSFNPLYLGVPRSLSNYSVLQKQNSTWRSPNFAIDKQRYVPRHSNFGSFH